MSDFTKTGIFAGAAVLLVAVAIVLNIPRSALKSDGGEGTALFPEFTDPQNAGALEIVKVDEERGRLQTFKVERSKDGLWVIPTHADYPANASEQMAAAALSLVDLEVVAVVSQSSGDQEEYGVVEPVAEKIEAGAKNFGMLVDLKDRDGKDLARLIIGKQSGGGESLRFVRKAGQDAVYVVKLDTSKLTTNFADWIDKDLLTLSAFDIDRVAIKDYKFLAKATEDSILPKFDPRLEMTASLDSASNAWELDKLTQFINGQPVTGALAPDEELNKAKLDELKSAVDSLQIVDVVRKPENVGSDLTIAPQLVNAMKNSLFGVGLLPAKLTGSPLELLGTEGEVNIGMKDGVEYVLRFGNTAPTPEGEDSAKSRRMMFVYARLDESRLKPPMLTPLPDKPADVPKPPGENKPPSGDAPPANTEEKGNSGQDQVPPGDAAAAAQAPPDKGAEKPAATPPQTPAAGEKPPASQFDLERERIEKENKRKMDEYNERRRKAEAKVRELNERFAPWYYIISDEEYQKIHLTRTELIKEKSGPGQEGFGPDAFRDLEKGGIKPPPPAPVAPPGGNGLPPGLNFPPM